MKLPNRLRLHLLAPVIVFCTCLLEGRLPVRLELIDSLGDPGFVRGFGPPWAAGSGVFYYKNQQGDDPSGIFKGPRGPVVTNGETIDGGNVYSLSIEDVSGDTILFSASTNCCSGDTDRFESALFLGTGSTANRILSRYAALPGYPNPHPSSSPIKRATLDDGNVAFHIGEYHIREVFQPSGIAMWNGSAIASIATGSGSFGNIWDGTRPVIDGDTVTFIYGKTA